MPPNVKVTKEEIIAAAVGIVREKGYAALTARETAARLGVSTRPIFTHFDTMEQVKNEVCLFAKELYRSSIERGLSEPVPFLGIGRQFIRFAGEEPELYKLLFLTSPGGSSGGAAEYMRMSQDMARESLMRIYRMDERTADCYYRDLWLVAFGFCALIVTGDCPYTDGEMSGILSEISLSVCKAYKEIPGLPEGRYDKEAIFRELTGTGRETGADHNGIRTNNTESGAE